MRNHYTTPVLQYAGERRDPHPWILYTEAHRVEGRVLSHIFSRIVTASSSRDRIIPPTSKNLNQLLQSQIPITSGESINQKMVGCERHYRVQWKDTWMPESELAGAKELVDTFMANNGSGTRGRKRPLKRGRSATRQPDARGGEEPKKRRGRPRKQN
ncbi:hypothetical protein BKA61DRAFT_585123 [Leptodontidium sp. MPI-SDFR-AT-0119]|nr:hypothetical protein BKA61DRAFT_585123 [Leptodontidium sp. MPI-SDFR-AT-0119]